MIGPKFYAWDRNGKPLAFGKLYTYQARTNVPKPTYQSEDQVVENTNPVILNGEGYANVYLDGSYKMVLKDDKDNEIWSSDPVSSNMADEWVNCLSAEYLSPTSFKVTGNFTHVYDELRKLRLSDGGTSYYYAKVKDAIYAGGETTVTVTQAVVNVALENVCTSIVGYESGFNSLDLSEISILEFESIDKMKSGVLIGGEEIEFIEGQRLSTGFTKWVVSSSSLNGISLPGGMYANPFGEISFADYGADRSGSVSVNAQLAEADLNSDFRFPAGKYLVDDDFTIKNNIYFDDGAEILISENKTLTIEGLVYGWSDRNPFSGIGKALCQLVIIDVSNGENIQEVYNSVPKMLYQKVHLRLETEAVFDHLVIENCHSARAQRPGGLGTESARLQIYTNGQGAESTFAHVKSLYFSDCSGNGNPNVTHIGVDSVNEIDNENAGVASYNCTALVQNIDFSQSTGIQKALLAYGGGELRTGYSNFGNGVVEKALVTKVMSNIYDDGGNSGTVTDHVIEQQSGQVIGTRILDEVYSDNNHADSFYRTGSIGFLGMVQDVDTRSLLGPQIFQRQSATMFGSMFESIDGFLTEVGGAGGNVQLNPSRGLQLNTQTVAGGSARAYLKRNFSLGNPNWEDSYMSLAVAIENSGGGTGTVTDLVIGDTDNSHVGVRIKSTGIFGVVDGVEFLTSGIGGDGARRLEVIFCKNFVEIWLNENFIGKSKANMPTGAKENVKVDFKISNSGAENSIAYLSEFRFCAS